MTVTLRDIARKAGLSVPTVSLVLNGRAKAIGISDPVIEKVQRLARELNYRPNAHARAVRSGRFGCVTLLVVPGDNCVYMEMPFIRGVHYELMKQHTRLSVTVLDRLEGETQLPIDNRWAMSEVYGDGLLVVGHRDNPLLQPLRDASSIPAIWINNPSETDSCLLDDLGTARQAIQRLGSLGHQRIAAVHVAREPGSHGGRLKAACATAMSEAGLPPDATLRVSRHELQPAVASLLDRSPRITGVIAIGKIAVTTLIREAMARKIAIPRELSLMSVTDTDIDDTGMAITGYSADLYNYGKAAGRMLIQRIAANGKSIPSQSVPYLYYPGETLGPCAG